MTNPEGVVVKSNGKYDYRYFMRDYLGNVRYVSGILQYTDYDPLGKIIYSSNLDKNVYLYEGKERIPNLAEEYESVYDFGARYYNPLYGRWFAPDPAKQGINPYVYCGNNPVQLVDPDGRFMYPGDYNWFYKKDEKFLAKLYNKQTRLMQKMGDSELSERKATRLQNKFDQNNEAIYRVREDMNNLDLMKNDQAYTYVMKQVDANSSNGQLGVFLRDNNIVEVQYSSNGTAAHERAHVGQSINAGYIEFDEETKGLYNAAERLPGDENDINDKQGYYKLEQKTKNEIDAYRMQRVFDGPYSLPGRNGNININGIYDMNPNSIADIIYNGKPAYPFANKYINHPLYK